MCEKQQSDKMKKLLLLAIASLGVCSALHADDDKNEKEIAVKDLPKAVMDAIKAKYPKAEIEEAEEITTKEGKIYEVELEIEEEGKEVELEIEVSAAGKILKIEKEHEDDDDDEDDEEEGDDD